MRIRPLRARPWGALVLGLAASCLPGCGDSAAEDPYRNMEMIDPAAAGAARQSRVVDPVLEEERRANESFSPTSKEKGQDRRAPKAGA
ncbi:hypothetical protein OJF2_05010 [Aquisphaera giovannonii]|uniref:Lipoprotein n=1 Tax=Aquisphaera giovannonii TaxID=406548 RepID=A0A5B9VUS9_9BACT|nr:hypothetical protein [Aquisphaera giovannonii]QEH32032.1 hypothetical protein OJF2_05010 [Aquisphaera giovannonii]